MVPTSLKLSNFTSYGPEVPELDFTKFHLAAISGQNGAGKSSLLDSITWCVWGSSRLGDSSDQLVRLGQGAMWVEVSFRLDGHLYTIKRQRILKGGGSTALEFFSGSHNLTEGTIKATQQKIIDTLHLSYETFVNSAFIRQGHADEFTTKGPTDRKRILADILGLAHYDELEEKAKEKAKEIQNKLQLLEYQLLEIEAELSQKEEREKALSKAEEDAQAAEKQVLEVERLIREIQLEKEAVSAKHQALEEKRQRLQSTLQELADLQTQIGVKEKAIAEYQTVLDQRTLIEQSYAKLGKLQEEKKSLDSLRSELIKAKDELVVIQQTLVSREKKRDQAIADKQVEIKEQETKIAQLQREIDHLKTHKDSCPTCGQAIGTAKNKEIIAHNEKLISQHQDILKELSEKVKTYQTFVIPEAPMAKEKELEVKKLEAQTKGYSETSEQVNSLAKFETLYTKLQQADTAVKTHREAIIDLQKIYSGRQKQIAEEEKELELLPEYEKQLNEVRLKLQAQETEKQNFVKIASEARSKVGEAKTLRDRSAQLEDHFKEEKEKKEKLQKDKEAFEELALAFGKKGIQTMIIETAIPEVEDETNRLLDKLTEGRMRVRFETQKETKTKVNGEHGIVETLDIIISDEMGERPYEAYSGGEQFRVNFAIRLALSKLLTHRAGAKLQFLVIDEGFGTQDAQGRSRIVEALSAIKDDFEKILVITHLDELKEEFPVRVEVNKSPTGSTFEVVGV